MGAVDVKHTQEHELTLEWESSSSNDMIADSTLALITGIDKSPASVKLTTQPSHSHPHPHADIDSASADMTRIQRLVMFLEAHFGDVELHMPEEVEDDPEQGEDSNEPSLLVSLDEVEARINLISMTVVSSHESLRKRVETILDMAVSTVSSLAESFMSGIPLGSEDGVLNKNKASIPAEVEAQDKNAKGQGDIPMGNSGKNQDEAEESSELTEQSEDEGRMLQVHD